LTDLLALAERVAAQAGNGEEVEAYVARTRRTSVLAHGGEVESLTQAEAAGVGIRVIVETRQGFAWAGSLDEDVVAETLAEARDNTVFGQPDPFVGLAAPDGVEPPAIDPWSDELDATSVESKVALALELERLSTTSDPRVRSVRTAAYGDALAESAVASSAGLRSSGRAAISYLAVAALGAADGDTTFGGGTSAGRAPSELSAAEAAADAVERATRVLGAKKPPTQRVTLVVEPRLTSSLLSLIGGMLGGDAVLKGRSPFAERVGEQIASPLLTFVDDPTNPVSLGASRHDGEGLAHRCTPLVDGGVLRGFLHNTYSGRRSGMGSTGSAVRGFKSTPSVGARALAVLPGAGSLDDLLAAVEHGLLVQTMTGLHSGVNPVSGDFSVGVEGLMIRSGQLAEPIREATIASTLQRLLLDISAVGADLEWLPSGTGGVTLVIPDIALAGA
jgi:PmbA protein